MIDYGLVSVILPTFNREKTLLKSIMSVLNQSYSNLELIIVDDGSTDDSRSLIESISDTRVKYVYQNNSGACIARNHGVNLATGSFLAFQDSDDEWLPDKLRLQLIDLFKNHSDVSVCTMLSHDLENNVDRLVPNHLIHDIDFPSLLAENYVSTQMIVCKRDVFNTIQFDPNLPRLQDWDLVIRMAKSYSFSFLSQTLVIQNVSSDSISKNNRSLILALNYILNKYSDDYSRLKRSRSRVMSNLAFAYEVNGMYRHSCLMYLKSLNDHFLIQNLIKLIRSFFFLLKSFI